MRLSRDRPNGLLGMSSPISTKWAKPRPMLILDDARGSFVWPPGSAGLMISPSSFDVECRRLREQWWHSPLGLIPRDADELYVTMLYLTSVGSSPYCGMADALSGSSGRRPERSEGLPWTTSGALGSRGDSVALLCLEGPIVSTGAGGRNLPGESSRSPGDVSKWISVISRRLGRIRLPYHPSALPGRRI